MLVASVAEFQFCRHLLGRIADLLEQDGWDPRYSWRKTSVDGRSIMEAARWVCDERYADYDICLAVIRGLIHPHGMKSIADFESAPGRTAFDVVALLRAA